MLSRSKVYVQISLYPNRAAASVSVFCVVPHVLGCLAGTVLWGRLVPYLTDLTLNPQALNPETPNPRVITHTHTYICIYIYVYTYMYVLYIYIYILKAWQRDF